MTVNRERGHQAPGRGRNKEKDKKEKGGDGGKGAKIKPGAAVQCQFSPWPGLGKGHNWHPKGSQSVHQSWVLKGFRENQACRRSQQTGGTKIAKRPEEERDGSSLQHNHYRQAHSCTVACTHVYTRARGQVHRCAHSLPARAHTLKPLRYLYVRDKHKLTDSVTHTFTSLC